MKLHPLTSLVVAVVLVTASAVGVCAEPVPVDSVTIGGVGKGYYFIPDGSDLSLSYGTRSFGEDGLDSGSGFTFRYRDQLSWKIPQIQRPQKVFWGAGFSFFDYDYNDEMSFDCWLEEEIAFANWLNNNMKWTPSLTFGVGVSYSLFSKIDIPARTKDVVDDQWCELHSSFDDCEAPVIGTINLPAMQYKSESLLGLNFNTGLSINHNNSPWGGFVNFGYTFYPTKGYNDNVDSSTIFSLGTRVRF